MQGDEDDFDEDLQNEISFDDSLDSMARLEAYYRSQYPLQRQVLARELYDTAIEHGPEATISRLVPVLDFLVRDDEPIVRHVLVKQFPPLCAWLAPAPDGYDAVITHFLPHTFLLLVDRNVEVSLAAANALAEIAPLIGPSDVEPQLLHTIEALAVNDKADDYRMTAAVAYDRLAPVFGPALAESHVLPRIKALAVDHAFAVRRATVVSLVGLAGVLPPVVTANLVVPLFVTLSQDEASHVRKSAAGAIGALSSKVPAATRGATLVPLFERLLTDTSTWVRSEAQLTLCEFVKTLSFADVPASLLRTLSQLIEDATSEATADALLAEALAEGVPLAVAALGKGCWAAVSASVQQLAKDPKVSVRRKLATGLSMMAKALGPAETQASLQPIFMACVADVDEVRFAAVLGLAAFLQALPEGSRADHVAKVIAAPMPHTWQWRYRQLLMDRLAACVQTLTLDDVLSTIYPLVKEWSERECVSSVRMSTAAALAAVAVSLFSSSSHKAAQTELNDLLQSFASAPSASRRQFFCRFAVSLSALQDATQVQQLVLARVAVLAGDRVACVRVAAAEAVRGIQAVLPNNPTVQAAMQKLLKDSDADVVAWASAEHVPLSGVPPPSAPA